MIDAATEAYLNCHGIDPNDDSVWTTARVEVERLLSTGEWEISNG